MTAVSPTSPIAIRLYGNIHVMVKLVPAVCDSCSMSLWVRCLSELRSGYDYEVIVIDDNSPDGTQEVAETLQDIYGEDKIILRPRPGKLGLGG